MKKTLTVALGSMLSFFILQGSPELRGHRFSHPALSASDPAAEEKGFRNLTRRAYGVSMVNPKVFEKIWTVWEPEWKAKADGQDPGQIRRLTFERYGFSEAPYPNGGLPMQYVATEQGWVPTCMQCHGGRLPGSGQSVIGLPNTEIDLATFAEDLSKSFGLVSDQSRLGQTRGRTNAFVFGIELLRTRNEDLSKRSSPLEMGLYKNSDLDAIPWWHLKKKDRLYADGGLTGNFVRAIMQFTLAGPTGEKIKSWEPDFVDILAYLRSIQPPKYPWPVNEELASAGKRVFEKTCATCHGTYGPGGKYPNRVVPIDIIGTDPTRFAGVPPEFRRYYNRTWFGEQAFADNETPGYIAPPLDGIWASAPYFHNGAVPTVYGVLAPESRPRYFRRTEAPTGYDTARLGFTIEGLSGPPPSGLAPEARRRIVDTTRPGLSNAGHTFGAALTEKEKLQVLEYLKTL